ncbi:hypothetical protein D018_3478B, partial [Vibrio parahaemolyticus VP2007-007]
PV